MEKTAVALIRGVHNVQKISQLCALLKIVLGSQTTVALLMPAIVLLDNAHVVSIYALVLNVSEIY